MNSKFEVRLTDEPSAKTTAHSPPEGGKNETPRWMWLALGGVAIIAIALVAAMLLQGNAQLVYDENAAEGYAPSAPGQGTIDALQEAVDESMFRISVNSRPVFDPVSGEGNVLISNSGENSVNMKVTITLDSTGETVYESKLLAPGQDEAFGTLKTSLAAGSYAATAHISAVSADGTEMGVIDSPLALTVGSGSQSAEQTHSEPQQEAGDADE